MGSLKTSRSLPYRQHNGHYISPIWQAVIDKYYTELVTRGGVRDPTIDHDLWAVRSPGGLLKQIWDPTPTDSSTYGNWSKSLRRLGPILLNDIAAVIILTLGMNGQVAALIWASIRLILKLG